MGLFASRPRIASDEPAHERTVQPEWLGPPLDVLPGLSQERAVVVRTDDVVVTVGHFTCYASGVEFTLDLHLRAGDDESMEWPWERRHRRTRPALIDDDFMRFGARFSDGASWSNLDAVAARFDERPNGPVLSSQGGSSDPNRCTSAFWLWPLPPAGPVTFIVEWPKFGIAETTATVDGDALRAAAEQAEPLWRR